MHECSPQHFRMEKARRKEEEVFSPLGSLILDAVNELQI